MLEGPIPQKSLAFGLAEVLTARMCEIDRPIFDGGTGAITQAQSKVLGFRSSDDIN